MKKLVMGSRRGNLVLSKKNPSQETHYHGKSYHSRLERIVEQSTDRYQSCAFTFLMDAGERCAATQPGCHVSGIESDWLIGCCHTQGLGGFSQRRLANACASGVVA